MKTRHRLGISFWFNLFAALLSFLTIIANARICGHWSLYMFCVICLLVNGFCVWLSWDMHKKGKQ